MYCVEGTQAKINLMADYGILDPGRKKVKRQYINAVAAFDIETTLLDDINQSILYHWQCQIENQTITGRTWEDYKQFITDITGDIPEDVFLILFVHNLSYEWQYIRSVFSFETDDVFVMEPRKILYARTGHIEYRCSYLQTNMSLEAFTKKMGVENAKTSLDYTVKRYPWTQLSETEYEYCINDVKGLVQAMKKQIELEKDTLYTLPLTNTGYVRRDVKKAMKTVNKKLLHDMQPDPDVYGLLREAFRGGNTHANRFYTGDILENVTSWDISSSYPAQQCLKSFPMGAWVRISGDVNLEYVLSNLIKKHRCVLMRIVFFKIQLSRKMWGCPYLSSDKCRNVKGGAYDNGRILKADVLETSITDIDLDIILSEYEFSECIILDLYHCRSGLLPEQWRECNMNYFRSKTLLKNVSGSELLYMKSKNKLNSIYGMSVTDPCKQTIKYENGDYHMQIESIEDRLAADQRYIYRNYAWGVWTTAHARRQLEDALNLIPIENYIYCDTDSVKFIGDADFETYNKQLRKLSIQKRVYADDPSGTRHYMGVFEHDGFYNKFVTLGAKKYAYEDETGLHITVAGVNKKKGPAELGTIENFKEGFTFYAAGGTRSIYNDAPVPDRVTIDGNDVDIISNIAILSSEYTLGIAGDYARLLQNPLFWVDAFGEC